MNVGRFWSVCLMRFRSLFGKRDGENELEWPKFRRSAAMCAAHKHWRQLSYEPYWIAMVGAWP
jgi:hypothetical protein